MSKGRTEKEAGRVFHGACFHDFGRDDNEKRIFSILLCLCLLVGLLPTTAFAASTEVKYAEKHWIQIDEAHEGSTISVELNGKTVYFICNENLIKTVTADKVGTQVTAADKSSTASYAKYTLVTDEIEGYPSTATIASDGSTVAHRFYLKKIVEASAVTLNKTSTTLTVGDTETLTATVEPSGATNKAVTWTSSNASVATVDSTGKVTAKAAGTSTITVTTADGGKTDTCTVTVTAAACPKDDTCPIAKFTDADPTEWYHDGVHYCVENEIMEGYPGNLLKPGNATTRAQAVTMLWRLEGEPEADAEITFEDVSAKSYYADAVRWAASEGIVKDYSAERFGPDDSITREQLVTIMWRYAEYKGLDVSIGESTSLDSYDDAAEVSAYAVSAMKWACGSGVVIGISDTKLAPGSTASRAQIATIFQRFDEDIVK